jgi:hypothetical protein
MLQSLWIPRPSRPPTLLPNRQSSQGERIGIGEASHFNLYNLVVLVPGGGRGRDVRARRVLSAYATDIEDDGAEDGVVELLGTLHEEND